MSLDLQKESDVKDYLEKLGIEYRFGCYSEKRPEGEFIAGRQYRHCVYIRNPNSECDFVFISISNFLLESIVCHLLGDYLESIKKDFEKASKVYRSNCDDYGYSRSCYKFGNYSFLGKGRSGGKSCASEALTYYEKGCNLKDADSCLHSGLMLVSRSPQENVKRDVPRVFNANI